MQEAGLTDRGSLTVVSAGVANAEGRLGVEAPQIGELGAESRRLSQQRRENDQDSAEGSSRGTDPSSSATIGFAQDQMAHLLAGHAIDHTFFKLPDNSSLRAQVDDFRIRITEV